MSPRRSTLPDIPLPASRRQINIAGERIREWWYDRSIPSGALLDDPELRAALMLMVRFRIGFQDPLNRVTMGVRSFVKSESAPIVVAQRLKRLPTIMQKLARFPNMDLTRMQDIAGCRAIVPTQRHALGVVRRARRQGWDIVRFDDYNAVPKVTGYRAVHLAVRRRGRLVEVQLRTPLQQRWAAEVDRAAGQVGTRLKDGLGPADVVEAFGGLADRIADLGDARLDRAAEADLDDRFRAIRQQVQGYGFPNE
jgi:putative GTP pyrophosphokinase